MRAAHYLPAPSIAPRTDPHLQNHPVQMKRELEKLRTENEKLRTENENLQTEKKNLQTLQGHQIRAYQDKIVRLNDKVHSLEAQILQEILAGEVGKEIRLRFLEHHRKRMKKGIGPLTEERIECGNRAAHHGRPVVDALLCLTGPVTDHRVYSDLYGVSPEIVKECQDIPAVVEICGYHGSLKSEKGRLRREEQKLLNEMSLQNEERLQMESRMQIERGLLREVWELFEQIVAEVCSYHSPAEIRAAFEENKNLKQLRTRLKVGCDKILAMNRGKF